MIVCTLANKFISLCKTFLQVNGDFAFIVFDFKGCCVISSFDVVRGGFRQGGSVLACLKFFMNYSAICNFRASV